MNIFLAQLQFGGFTGWTLLMGAVLVIAVLVIVILAMNFLSIYIRALVSGAKVTFTELIALRLRGVPVGLIVDSRITAVKSGIEISIDQLNAHYQAGGNVEMVVRALIMARKALERADVAILIIDAIEGATHLDANIAGYAVDSGCSVIIAVNKWDAIEEKETNTIYEFERDLRQHMKFLDWAPMVAISALTGQRVTKILPLVAKANAARNTRVPTAQLNKFFEDSISQPRGGSAPAPVAGGVSRLKVQYITRRAPNLSDRWPP